MAAAAAGAGAKAAAVTMDGFIQTLTAGDAKAFESYCARESINAMTDLLAVSKEDMLRGGLKTGEVHRILAQRAVWIAAATDSADVKVPTGSPAVAVATAVTGAAEKVLVFEQQLIAELKRKGRVFDESAYTRMVMTYRDELQALANTSVVSPAESTRVYMQFYEAAVRLPRSTTLRNWAENYALVLDGPYLHKPNFHNAFLQPRGEGTAIPLLVKTLTPSETARITRFAAVLDVSYPNGDGLKVNDRNGLPELHPRLVPVALIPPEIAKPVASSPLLPAVAAKLAKEAAEKAAGAGAAGAVDDADATGPVMRLVMPHLPVTASDYARLLSAEQLEVFYTDISGALSQLHAVHCTHSDVKPNNIGVTDDGHFALFDLGSVSVFSSPLRNLCTQEYLPAEYHAGAAAASSPLVDWLMLAVTLGAMINLKALRVVPAFVADVTNLGADKNLSEAKLIRTLNAVAPNTKWWPALRARIEAAKKSLAADAEAGKQLLAKLSTLSPVGAARRLGLRRP